MIEGRVGTGSERLGVERFAQVVADARAACGNDGAALVRTVVERAEELNGGPLLDDVALVLVATR